MFSRGRSQFSNPKSHTQNVHKTRQKRDVTGQNRTDTNLCTVQQLTRPSARGHRTGASRSGLSYKFIVSGTAATEATTPRAPH